MLDGKPNPTKIDCARILLDEVIVYCEEKEPKIRPPLQYSVEEAERDLDLSDEAQAAKDDLTG